MSSPIRAIAFVICFDLLGPVAHGDQVQLKLDAVEQKASVGNWMTVRVLNLDEAIKKDKLDIRKLTLSLDGQALKGLVVLRTGAPRDDEIKYYLDRGTDNTSAWNAILGHPESNKKRVAVRLFNDGTELLVADTTKLERTNTTLEIFDIESFHICEALFFLTLMLFWMLVVRSDILRDSAPPEPVGRRPYSLSRVQMAIWLFVILGSYLFLFVITQTYQLMSEQALVLLGISAATVVAGTAIDASKRSSADEELAKLRPVQARAESELVALAATTQAAQAAAANPPTFTDTQLIAAAQGAENEKKAEVDARAFDIQKAEKGLTTPASDGFWNDILTDANGVSLHRFQMLVWTVVLAGVFLRGVYDDLAMPQFNGTLLALMGITSGTYLGLKIPEQQTK